METLKIEIPRELLIDLEAYEISEQKCQTGMSNLFYMVRKVDKEKYIGKEPLDWDVANTSPDYRLWSLSDMVSEIVAQTKIHHPCVLKPSGISLLHHGVFMPLIITKQMTTSLEQIRVDNESYSFTDFMIWAVGIADAMTTVHDCCVMHRDIKPDNIYVDEQEDGVKWPYLADFGLACSIKRNSYGELIQCIWPVGTEGFQAPEIENAHADGSCSYDYRVDQYAFGQTLNCMKTEPTNDKIDEIINASCQEDREDRPSFKEISENLLAVARDEVDMEKFVKFYHKMSSDDRTSEEVAMFPPNHDIGELWDGYDEFVDVLMWKLGFNSQAIYMSQECIEASANCPLFNAVQKFLEQQYPNAHESIDNMEIQFCQKMVTPAFCRSSRARRRITPEERDPPPVQKRKPQGPLLNLSDDGKTVIMSKVEYKPSWHTVMRKIRSFGFDLKNGTFSLTCTVSPRSACGFSSK